MLAQAAPARTASLSGQELLHWIPVVAVPAGVEVVVLPRWKAGVVEEQREFVVAWFQFESDNGVYTCIPVRGAPCLDDALVGDQLDVAAHISPPNCEKAPPGMGLFVAARPVKAVNCFSSRMAW